MFERVTRISAWVTIALILGVGGVSLLSPWALIGATWAAISLLRVPRARQLLEFGVISLLVCLEFHQGAASACLLAWGLLVPLLSFLAPEKRVLKMNGMDRYMVCQDYPGVPANVHLFIDVKEPFDRGSVERALLFIFREVPLARTTIREAFLGMERFVAKAPESLPARVLTWLDEPISDSGSEHLDRRFDLRREFPLRVTHAPRAEGGYRLILTVQHSIADGVGLVNLAQLTLLSYASYRNGSVPSQPRLDSACHRYRELFRPRGLPWLVRMLKTHVRPMDKVGTRNASLLDDESPRPSPISQMFVQLEPDTDQKLIQATRESGFTRNDLLVTAIVRASDVFRSRRKRPNQLFRLLLPMNLRPILGLPENCLQNFVGVVRSEFTPEEARSPELALLVSKKVRLGKDYEEAIETPVNLGFLSWALPPPVFRYVLKKFDQDPKSFFFSLIFSHVRLPKDSFADPPGNVIENISIRIPLTRQPGVAIGAASSDRKVTFCFTYLSAMVSETSIAEFVELFKRELGSLLS